MKIIIGKIFQLYFEYSKQEMQIYLCFFLKTTAAQIALFLLENHIVVVIELSTFQKIIESFKKHATCGAKVNYCEFLS